MDMTLPDIRSMARPLRAAVWSCRSADLPSASPSDLISDKQNRWNEDGERTIYLSGDIALSLIESGRHPDDLKGRSILVRLDVDLPSAIDLRDGAVRDALGLPNGVGWVLDQERTRQVSRELRESGACDGLIVPSAGALDQLDRWNTVVFADAARDVIGLLGQPQIAGEVRITQE